MELWIRSQNRKRLIPIYSELYIPNSRTDEDFGIFIEETETMLGHYATEQRALEVLDEIQNTLMENTLKSVVSSAYQLNNFVYEMPTE